MIIDCISKAILLFVIYNIVALMLFGVPKSLSMTYYLFKERNNSLRVLFPSTIGIICMLLLPCWLEISEGSPWQFTSFLSAGSLFMVAFTPTFKNSKMEHKIHTTSAYMCALFAVLWIVLVTNFWYILPIVIVIVSVFATWTKTWKTGFVYWMEMIAFVSTFSTIICHYVDNMI